MLLGIIVAIQIRWDHDLTERTYIYTYMYVHMYVCMYVCMYVTLSHLRSKESTGIHKPCIPILLHI